MAANLPIALNRTRQFAVVRSSSFVLFTLLHFLIRENISIAK
jgi:hypothetical protein